MVRDAPLFEEICEEVYSLLDGHVFVAHNVRFDYGFMKARFKANNIRFRTPHICTVELSKRIFPSLPSYSLGNLCKSLGIKVTNRHRAMGDTKAAAILFEMMWEKDSDRVLKAMQSDKVQKVNFPPSIDIEAVDDVPEKKGIYCFYNENNEYLFVSKSKNLRESILSHFKVPFSLQEKEMEKQVSSFYAIELPSEMTTMMMEAQEILINQPIYNRKIRNISKKYGLYLRNDNQGYLDFFVSDINSEREPALIKFNTLNKAKKFVRQHLQKVQLGHPFKQKHSIEKYNELVKASLKRVTYPHQNCWLIEKKGNQKFAVVYVVEDYILQGFSIQEDVKHKDFEEVLSALYKIDETTDMRRKFLQYLNRERTRLSVIDLGASNTKSLSNNN